MLSRRPSIAIPLLLVVFLTPERLIAKELENGIREIAHELSTAIAQKARKLAVAGFSDLNGNPLALGEYIAEELTTQLSLSNQQVQFDILERRRLVRAMQGPELAGEDIYDAKSLSKIGKLLEIDAIVTGSVVDLGNEIKITARASSTETGKILAATSRTFPKGDTVQSLLNQVANPALSGDAPRKVQSDPRRQTQPDEVIFQNEFLRVEVSSAAVAKAKNRVSFSLAFQNLSAQDLLLAVDSSYHYCRARVTDNLGVVVPTKNYGEEVFITGMPCLYGDGDKKDQKEYARLSPGARTSVVIAFETEHEQFDGTILSLSAELLRYSNDGFSKFSMGIAGIEAQQ